MVVSRRVVAAAAVLLLGLVGAVGFLLGRESGRAQVRSEAGAAESRRAPEVAAVPAPAVPAAAPAPSSPPAARPEAAPSGEALAVRDYFAGMAAIQSAGSTGDVTGFANQLLGSAMAGNPSGFDALIETAKEGAARARRLRVPAPCAGYHGAMLSVLDDSIALLRALKAALERQDGDALLAIGAKASALQTRTEALAKEERSIRARFGVSN